MNYSVLLTFSAATALLAISPGPDNLYVMVQSMTHGKKYGLATVAGLMTGCLVHTTLLAFGVSLFIKDNPTLYYGIKVFGALYLFYLAYQVYKDTSSITWKEGPVAKKGTWALFKRGFVMNVLNPKVTIFFLAFFPGFLFSDEMSPILQFYILGFVFILVSSMVFGAIALMAGGIGSYLKKHAHVGRLLKWLQIIVFIGLAIYLLMD